jgi:hypothetical protein
MIICCPLIEGVIEYDHGDQIPAVLLQSSHCGGKLLKGDGTAPPTNFSAGCAIRATSQKLKRPPVLRAFPELHEALCRSRTDRECDTLER